MCNFSSHYFIHCKPYIQGRDTTVSILQTRMKNMDRLTQRPLLEWLSWNTRRNGPNSCSGDHLCFEWIEKESVFWVLELFHFPRVCIEVKLLKIPRYQILPLQEEKLRWGGDYWDLKGSVNDTPGFLASLSSKLVLIETEKRRHQEFKLYFF